MSKIFGTGEGRGETTRVLRLLEEYFEEEQGCLIVHFKVFVLL